LTTGKLILALAAARAIAPAIAARRAIAARATRATPIAQATAGAGSPPILRRFASQYCAARKADLAGTWLDA